MSSAQKTVEEFYFDEWFDIRTVTKKKELA